MTTLAQLTSDVQLYTTYDDADFVAQIPRFIQNTEEQIFYTVPVCAARKNGACTV